MNAIRPLGFALLTVALVGCVSSVKFGEELYRLTCERQYECAQGAFEEQYGDVGECRTELADMVGDLYACQLDSCSFDAVRARQCLHDLRSSDCDDVVDGSAFARCDDVFVDCDDEALYACVGA